MMKLFSTVFILIIVLVGITFAILNASPVHLNYYFGKKDISLSLLLALTLGAGTLLGFLCTLLPILRLRRRNSKLKAHVKQAEKEIENLRAIPIKDSH